jgi:hypothetical protein
VNSRKLYYARSVIWYNCYVIIFLTGEVYVSRSPEVNTNCFIVAAADAFVGPRPFFALWRQAEAMPELTAIPDTHEMSVDAYLAFVNEFVVDTVHTIQLQRHYLSFMRSNMAPATVATVEAEIARTCEAIGKL